MQPCPECEGTGVSNAPSEAQSYAERRAGQFQNPPAGSAPLSYAEARAAQFQNKAATGPAVPVPCERCKRSGVKGYVLGEPLTMAELRKLLGLPVKAT